jgi:hypothetical protein
LRRPNERTIGTVRDGLQLIARDPAFQADNRGFIAGTGRALVLYIRPDPSNRGANASPADG